MIEEVALALKVPEKLLARDLRMGPIGFVREGLLLPKVIVGDLNVDSDRIREVHRGLCNDRVSDRGRRWYGHGGGDGRLRDHRYGSGHSHGGNGDGLMGGCFERDHSVGLGQIIHFWQARVGNGKFGACAFGGPLESSWDTISLEGDAGSGMKICVTGHAGH